MRIKIEIDIEQPLMRGTKLMLEGEEVKWVKFKYERLPFFCYSCGLLGHRYLDCSRRLDVEQDSDSEELPYPKSLMVTPYKAKMWSKSDTSHGTIDRNFVTMN